MSCKQEREIVWVLCIVTVVFYNFQIGDTISVGKLNNLNGFTAYHRKASPVNGWESIEEKNDAKHRHSYSGGRVILRGAPRRISGPQSPVLREKSSIIVPTPNHSGNNPVLTLSWSSGNVSEHRSHLASDIDGGYQADFPGFKGHVVQGKVFGLGTHVSEWLAMRPMVQCDDNVMTLTANGRGYTHLLVDREGASPLSLSQLPLDCGYSVRTSWSDLVMMAPYDGCYFMQENGSYVLPMLWWGSPLKLSCPVQSHRPALQYAPSVFCSPYGMAVQVHGEEGDIATLGVKVNGKWAAFVSEECAYRMESQPDQLIFFSSLNAPCLTVRDEEYFLVFLNRREFILSCPVFPPLFPYFPSPPLSPPLSPSVPQDPYSPYPVTPAPTTPPPPQAPTRRQLPQHPDYLNYLYPGLHYPQLPQVHHPGPQPPGPQRPRPAPGSPPGHPSHQSTYHMGPGYFPYPPGGHLGYPSPHYPPSMPAQSTKPAPGKAGPPPQIPQLPMGSPQYTSDLYYPQVPNYYLPITPAPPPAAPPTIQSPKVPVGPNMYHTDQFYPPGSYNPYFPYGPIYYPQPTTEPPPTTAATTATSTTRAVVPQQPVDPHYPLGPSHPPGSYGPHYYPYGPFYFYPHAPPSSEGKPPSVPQATQQQYVPLDPSVPTARPFPRPTCPPNAQTICSYYPYPPPHYHPPYPPYHHVPLYPTPTASPSVTPTTRPPGRLPPQPPPSLHCQAGRMMVLLPSADPDSLQVRGQGKTWLPLSSVPPLCGYRLQKSKVSGVILHTPLPGCHSRSRAPGTVSVPLRFWDLVQGQTRTLELQCPYVPPPGTPAPVTLATTPPSTSTLPRPRVFCSLRQMTVELPPGPISGVAVKDIKGKRINLQEAPKHCGYSAGRGKDGKIILNIPFDSCHMSVEGKVHSIIAVYMTVDGRKGEARLSCPISIPVSDQECNLPSEQRLPCGPASPSQSRCLSLGCCFSALSLACYYPMDECTVDRHFVFLVPASLTEPPLSPALLVAAGNSTCMPQKVTAKYALFKIPLDGCGARRLEVGKTVIYMVEIVNMVQTITLSHATITRDSPVRLLVECRYLPGSVVSVGYMVKSPSLGPSIHAQGIFGVQLRIAKDAQYSSYLPQYHQPLQMLLGKPLHLEVRLLNPPDPKMVLLVHYCVAYPRSGKAAWVLLYNGCPNPLDPAPKQTVLSGLLPPAPQGQTRRFTINTFQFLSKDKTTLPDEEIYFMCSTEVCSPLDSQCVEGCFGQ